MGIDSQIQADASVDVHPLPRGAGGGQVSCLSCLSSRPYISSRRMGEMGEEGGHLYECIKMFYKDNYHLQPVWIHGTEDAISLVRSISLSCLKHEFYSCPFPLFPALTKVVYHLLFSDHEGPPSTKWNTLMSTGEESIKSWWWSVQACLPLLRRPFSGLPECLMQMLLWSLEQPPAPQGSQGVTLQSPRAHIGSPVPHQITTNVLHSLALPAECFSASDEDSMSETQVNGGSSKALEMS